MKKYVAECLGTFVLTLFGCGTAIVTSCSTENYSGYLLTAIAFGLSIVAMAYAIGDISGCHVNPAVSLAMLLNKKLNIKDFALYVIAQCVGAVAAGAVLMAIFGKESGLGSNGLYNGNIFISLGIEVLLTCIFLFLFLGVTSSSKYESVAGIVIGLSLTFVHIFGIGLTGTSVNPARSLVGIFVGGEALSNLWVFIVAPMLGAILATVFHMYFISGHKREKSLLNE